jgi:predicted  nucleic acid-binding Zn-ribbon protein
VSGRNFAFLDKRGSREGNTSSDFSAPRSLNASGHSSAQYSAASTTQRVLTPADDKCFSSIDNAADSEAMLTCLRTQVISNEMELLHQRLHLVRAELDNRSHENEQLQREVAVAEYRAEAAERALADLQREVQMSAAAKRQQLQVDASCCTTAELTLPLLQPHMRFRSDGCAGSSSDASTQTQNADAEVSSAALLQQLIAASSSPPSGASRSPASSTPSHRQPISIDHVNAKADHLAAKLEELLFNMSVQQREFSKLSRAACSLFRTLTQTLHALANCYSILSGGHDEQVPQRRYMMIEREMEGRDVGVFAAEACVLIEDAIEAVNLVNLIRPPASVHLGSV